MARRPMELTQAQKAEVETLAAVLTTEQIADYFGIGRRTFYSMMERDEEIAARYKKGKARAIGAIAQGLIAKARGGDTTSMIFYLKTQAGWRETQHLEMTGQNGGPIQTSDSGSARQHLILRLNALSQKMLLADEPEAISAPPVIHVAESAPVVRSLP
ncbi:MAG: hypothetical protein ACOH2H_07200 [Cypionkella sp.]